MKKVLASLLPILAISLSSCSELFPQTKQFSLCVRGPIDRSECKADVLFGGTKAFFNLKDYGIDYIYGSLIEFTYVGNYSISMSIPSHFNGGDDFKLISAKVISYPRIIPIKLTNIETEFPEFSSWYNIIEAHNIEFEYTSEERFNSRDSLSAGYVVNENNSCHFINENDIGKTLYVAVNSYASIDTDVIYEESIFAYYTYNPLQK